MDDYACADAYRYKFYCDLKFFTIPMDDCACADAFVWLVYATLSVYEMYQSDVLD